MRPPTGKKEPISAVELSIVRKMQRLVTFPPATASKRFVNTLSDRSQLTDKGRRFLAFIAHRFRRQWIGAATEEEFHWIVRYNVPRKALEKIRERDACQSSLAF
jgi:hypothetical protein